MNELSKPSQMDVIDLRVPHPSFAYPEFATITLSEDSTEATNEVKRLISPVDPQSVCLFENISEVYAHWLNSLDPALPRTVLVLAPIFPELKRALEKTAFQAEIISRDPEEWDFNREFSAVILSHPLLSDGFYYPEEIYQRLLEQIRAKSSCPILSDESLQVFSFSLLPPATLKKKRLQEKNIFIAGSIYPAFSPQGPKTAWWINNPLSPLPLAPGAHEKLDSSKLEISARALLSFSMKQGAAVEEFHRRMLVLRQGLRHMTDILNPAISTKRLFIPFWPEAGFYLRLGFRIPGFKSARELQAHLAEEQKLFLDLSDESDIRLAQNPSEKSALELRLCFAAPERLLKQAAERIVEFCRRDGA